MNLTQKYRSTTLDEVIGHDKVIKDLRKRSKEDNFPQVILLEGITGTGKTTLARIIGMTYLCKHKDKDGRPCLKCDTCKDILEERFTYGTVKEKDARDIKVEQIEEIRDFCEYDQIGIDRKVLFIDEYQGLYGQGASKAAADKMLKILEKKYSNILFILGTMDGAAIPSAVKNRTVRFILHPLSLEQIVTKLLDIAQSEGVKIDSEEKENVIIGIAEYSEGSMRTAISYLESCINGELWTEKDLIESLNIVTKNSMSNLLTDLVQGKPSIFEVQWTEEIVNQIRRQLLSIFKHQKGVNIPVWEYNKIKEFSHLPKDRVEYVLRILLTLQDKPYLNREVIEFTLLDCLVAQETNRKRFDEEVFNAPEEKKEERKENLQPVRRRPSI